MAPALAQIDALPAAARTAFVALLGLLLGSFLNVCITRLPRHESIVLPGSRCPECGNPVRPYDNIPVVSWLLLGRRCRDCRRPIPWRYPLVEVASAALLLLSVARFGYGVEGWSAAVACLLFLGLLVTDAETFLLPDALTLPGLALGLAHAALVAEPPLLHRLSDAGGALLAAASLAALLLAVRTGYWLVRRRHGMGLGDVKLIAMIAAWLGVLPTLTVLVLAVFAAGISGIAVVLGMRLPSSLRPRGEHPRPWQTIRLPLGCFLSAAALVVLFNGPAILRWYLS